MPRRACGRIRRPEGHRHDLAQLPVWCEKSSGLSFRGRAGRRPGSHAGVVATTWRASGATGATGTETDFLLRSRCSATAISTKGSPTALEMNFWNVTSGVLPAARTCQDSQAWKIGRQTVCACGFGMHLKEPAYGQMSSGQNAAARQPNISACRNWGPRSGTQLGISRL